MSSTWPASLIQRVSVMLCVQRCKRVIDRRRPRELGPAKHGCDGMRCPAREGDRRRWADGGRGSTKLPPLPMGHGTNSWTTSALGELRTRKKGQHRKQVGSRKRKRGIPLMAPPRLGTGIGRLSPSLGGPQALKPPTMARIQPAPDGHHRLSTARSACFTTEMHCSSSDAWVHADEKTSAAGH